MSIKSVFDRIKNGYLMASKKEPRGELIVGVNAERVLEGWNQKVVALRTRAESIVETRSMIDKRLVEISDEIGEATANLMLAKKNYLERKTTTAKKRWARRVIHSHNLLKYLQESKISLKYNLSRSFEAVEDCRSLAYLIEAKMKDAEIYYRLNGHIRLIGSALAIVETVSLKTEELEKEYEVSLEGLATILDHGNEKTMIAEAESIIKK